MHDSLPFLTADLPGVGGIIKVQPEDFLVEELPRYEASGAGTHTYAFIEKRGIGTREALNRIARAVGVLRKDIGAAGLKDARAVTRQWISIEHVEPQQVEQVSIPAVQILQTTRHTNKLKPGHLRGNRFVIRLRNPVLPLEEAARIAGEALQILTQKGVPNYFGPQRFGNRDDNHWLGRAVIRNDASEFMDLFLGRPMEGVESESIFHARSQYEQGHYEEALACWPRHLSDRCRALRAMAKTKGDKKRAYYGVDKHLKSLFISAYQSALFNQILAARMPHIDKLLLGDMAYKHENGACFRVDEPETEQPRCDRFEISPTGPLLGERTTRLTGPAGEIEDPILDAEGLSEGELRQMKRLGARGGRRPLRFQPRDIDVATGQDDLGGYLELHFELDPGCYATTLITEVTKDRSLEDSE